MAITFDGPTKRISLSAGTVSLGVRDLWSRWIDWLLTGDNSKYQIAMSQVGGDTIDAGSGTSIPIYAFLLNGWRVVPQASDHTLGVGDGILLVAGGGDPFVNPVGSHAIRINYSQPVQAITVSTGGGTGGGVSPELEANIQRILDLAEADEELTPTVARKKHRVSKTVLLEKAVTGGRMAAAPVRLEE